MAEKKKKQIRNAVATKARILKEATAAFAKSGFRASRTDDIVKASKVSRRMLYHYYKDKEDIYREVLRLQWQDLRSWLANNIRVIPNEPLLEQIVSIFFDFLSQRPEFVRILMWEGLDGGRFSQKLWREAREPVFSQAESMVRLAQQQGQLKPDLDPAHFIVSFLGAVTFYFAYAPSLGQVFGKDPLSLASLKIRKTEILRLLRNHYL